MTTETTTQSGGVLIHKRERQMSDCPDCAAFTQRHWEYCPHCGADLTEGEDDAER